MARKRLFKRKSSRSFPKMKSYKKSGGKFSSVKLIDLYAMLYGAGRQYIAQAVSPITAKIPLGNFADNIVMGGINYAAAKFIPIKLVKEVAMKGLIIENAMIGQEGAALALGKTNMSSNSGAQIYG